MRHGEGRVLVDPTGVYADCLYDMNAKKEQYALYLNDLLVFKGSFDKEWKPSKGIFYIPISDVLLSIDTKVSKLSPDKEVELKEGSVSYVGPVKLDTNNLLVPFGSGTLTIGVKVYKGRFINNRDIDSCLVYENGQPVFDGSIRNLQYNVGVKYYPSGAKEEGFFKNGSLENGYRWDKDGRSVAVKGATRYEEYYKKKNGNYRVGKPYQDSTNLGNISTGVGSKRVPIERSNSNGNTIGVDSKPSSKPEMTNSGVFPIIENSIPSNSSQLQGNRMDSKKQVYLTSGYQHPPVGGSMRNTTYNEPIGSSGSKQSTGSRDNTSLNGSGSNGYLQGPPSYKPEVKDAGNIPSPPGMLKSKGGNSVFPDALNALSASQRQIKEEVVEYNDKGKDDEYYLINKEIRMSGSGVKAKNAFLENGYIYIPMEGKPHTYRKYVDKQKNGRYGYSDTVSRM